MSEIEQENKQERRNSFCRILEIRNIASAPDGTPLCRREGGRVEASRLAVDHRLITDLRLLRWDPESRNGTCVPELGTRIPELGPCPDLAPSRSTPHYARFRPARQ
jgi:hypothetical protein